MSHSLPTSGQFVWYNLTTADPAGSAAFYGRLFGWTTRDLHLGGALAATTFRSGEHEVGGVVKTDAARSGWLPLLSVEDVDAALTEAVRLGGSLLEPIGGPRAVVPLSSVVDPTGASFCPAPPSGSLDHLADAAIPGHFCWSELLTTDPARAAAFYGALVGWTAAEWQVGDDSRYWLFRRGDRDVAGMMPLPDAGWRTSCWLPYVQVVSAEETAALAEVLGGAIVTPPGDVPERGRSAVIEDPGGARVAVFALTIAA